MVKCEILQSEFIVSYKNIITMILLSISTLILLSLKVCLVERISETTCSNQKNILIKLVHLLRERRFN